MTVKNKEPIPIGFWIGLLIVSLLIWFVPNRCTAQSCDTIPLQNEHIQKFVVQPTKGKNDKIYMVYKVDEKNNILDLIPVSNSVYSYITLCEQNGVKPSLAIRLKNGVPYSIIKYKRKWEKLRKQ